MRKPSISNLLDILAKPALIGWANKLGLKGIEVNPYMKQKMSAGTSIHSQVEHACFDNQEDAARYSEFMLGKEVIAAEQDIETEWFVGRLDAIIRIDGKDYVVDYKKNHKGKLYLENKLQLIAYTMAIPAKMAIVGIPAFSFMEFAPEKREPYESIIIALSTIWQMKQEIGK